MNDRFEMAEKLLKRVKRLRDGLGDHGDPYEESLLTGVVTPELKIIVKEIFDHLRSVLDYCAREVVEKSVATVSANVYFLITNVTFKKENFKSRIGKLLPGILNNRPDLETVFESFQPFYSTQSVWLAEFATLCNENKHEQLSVSKRSVAKVNSEKREEGKVYVRYTKDDGTYPFENGMPLVLHDGYSENGES
ncbi:hypothetical protein HNR77_003524 [Paenibacillus sp. JGP012]|uniref:hypothetical protein n=1 Tax=Paenibacillus sp. JGP012 TaxID=2735914 RepID=UPI0016089452|nr:hypothetical protein [Paenibacillus sp. JGP012]MBB6022427.1 hypothetical protein [Paenibacillus sp. JGP012]